MAHLSGPIITVEQGRPDSIQPSLGNPVQAPSSLPQAGRPPRQHGQDYHSREVGSCTEQPFRQHGWWVGSSSARLIPGVRDGATMGGSWVLPLGAELGLATTLSGLLERCTVDGAEAYAADCKRRAQWLLEEGGTGWFGPWDEPTCVQSGCCAAAALHQRERRRPAQLLLTDWVAAEVGWLEVEALDCYVVVSNAINSIHGIADISVQQEAGEMSVLLEIEERVMWVCKTATPPLAEPATGVSRRLHWRGRCGRRVVPISAITNSLFALDMCCKSAGPGMMHGEVDLRGKGRGSLVGGSKRLRRWV
jgi:hypothetical protein